MPMPRTAPDVIPHTSFDQYKDKYASHFLLDRTETGVLTLSLAPDGDALTGVTPAEASQAAAACVRPPQLNQPIPVGDGAQLLARRPDVRQAEADLAAAAARVNVATADLFPSISLGGSIGATSLDADGLGDSENFRFSFGPLISWSFPNVFAARARIQQAGALSDAALANFDQTVLGALQETETALSNYANELDRRAALTEARDQAARAADLSRRYGVFNNLVAALSPLWPRIEDLAKASHD